MKIYDSETVALINEEGGQKMAGGTGWISASALIVCTLAGVGIISFYFPCIIPKATSFLLFFEPFCAYFLVTLTPHHLGVPTALASSGWCGIILLIICAATNAYTGVILGKSLAIIPRQVHDYADLAEHAAGLWGKRITQFSIYSTLFGVGIVFLILIGLMFNGIFETISPAFFTLVGAVVVIPIAVGLPTYSEIKGLSYLGLGATVFVAIACVSTSLSIFYSDGYNTEDKKFSHAIIHGATFPVAFSVFTFAFGATAVFPSIYVQMKAKEHWTRSVNSAFVVSLLLYGSVGVIGYLVFGDYLSDVSTFLAAMESINSHTGRLVSILCSICMILHLVSAFPIVANPVLLASERWLIESGYLIPRSPLLTRVIVRTPVLLLMLVLSLFFPYFLSSMSLVACISVSLSGYILPCVFYWRLTTPSRLEKIILLLVILFGIAGSSVGLYVGGKQLIQDVQANPNPFKNLFSFH